MISLLASAKATLRVIGLATVVQGNPGIDVVMPQVPNTEAIHVEKHVVVLIVRDNELVPSSREGWTTGTYLPGFTFVELAGEDVQFLPDAANPVATVPFQLPRLTNGCKWELSTQPAAVAADGSPGVQAGPHIDALLPRPPLIESYRPPIYEAAAAVLRVPYGSTSACRAVVRNEKRRRIDTNVEWATGGGVTIVGKHHERRLRLEGDQVLLVAGNVPRSLLVGSRVMDGGHFQAYYTMLVPNGREGCVRQEPAAGIQRCPDSTRALVARPPVPDVMHIITSECSNSQYP